MPQKPLKDIRTLLYSTTTVPKLCDDYLRCITISVFIQGSTLFFISLPFLFQDERYWPLMPPLPSYGFGREHAGPRYGSLIHGQHLKDVIITGM